MNQAKLPMDFMQRLALVSTAKNLQLILGIEVEFNRVSKSMQLAMTPHPAGLGDPLSNFFITSDLLECTTELITPPSACITQTLSCISDLYKLTVSELEEEYLWPLSTPPAFDKIDTGLISKFNENELGQAKRAYYQALASRYCFAKSTFCGVHINYSFPELFWSQLRIFNADKRDESVFRSDAYLALIRNYHRVIPLIIYLFGCSTLQPFNQALYPELTSSQAEQFKDVVSVRNSPFGFYRNDYFLSLDLNSFEGYIESVEKLMADENGPLGISELYGQARPKRTTDKGKNIQSTKVFGIEYVEIRTLDLNPFEHTGISKEQIQFLDVVMWWCMLSPSPSANTQEKADWQDNIDTVSLYGRQGLCHLKFGGEDVEFSSWAKEQMSGLSNVAEQMDDIFGGSEYKQVVEALAKHIGLPSKNLCNQWLGSNHQDTDNYIYSLTCERKHVQCSAPLQYFTAHLQLPTSCERSDKSHQGAPILS